MKYFRIQKWEKYQHYHRPRPKWFKVYTTINDEGTDWRSLNETQIGQLVRMMAYAALHENALPFHPEFIKEELGLKSKPNLALFRKLGIIKTFNSRKECISRENARVNSSVPSSEIRVQSIRVQRTEEEKSPTSAEVVAADPPIPVKFNERAIDLCRLLSELMLGNDPKARFPKTQKQKINWIGDMDKINRIDERTWNEIESVIRWCQADEFWKANVLSPSKLRIQFPKLLLASQRESGKGVSDHNRNAINDFLNKENRR